MLVRVNWCAKVIGGLGINVREMTCEYRAIAIRRIKLIMIALVETEEISELF